MEGVPEKRLLDGLIVKELEKTSKLLNIAVFLGLTSAVISLICVPWIFGEIKDIWGELNEEISSFEILNKEIEAIIGNLSVKATREKRLAVIKNANFFKPMRSENERQENHKKLTKFIPLYDDITTESQPSRKTSGRPPIHGVKTATSCKNCKSTAVNSCPAGPKGPKGRKGLPGDCGPDGIPGFDGVSADDLVPEVSYDAERCRRCPPGPIGPPGPEGKTGRSGLRGPPGLPGCGGKHGLPGPPGEPGAAGPPGIMGRVGLPGLRGRDGKKYIRNKGPQGPPGLRGRPGERGIPGKHGRKGASGKPGVVGLPGEPGPEGFPGLEGNSGLHGEHGKDAGYCPCPAQSKSPESSTRSPSPPSRTPKDDSYYSDVTSTTSYLTSENVVSTTETSKPLLYEQDLLEVTVEEPSSPPTPASHQLEYEKDKSTPKAVDPITKDPLESYGRDPPILKNRNNYGLSKGDNKSKMIQVEPSPMGADFDETMISKKENHNEYEDSKKDTFGEPSLPKTSKKDQKTKSGSNKKKTIPVAIGLPGKMKEEKKEDNSELRIADKKSTYPTQELPVEKDGYDVYTSLRRKEEKPAQNSDKVTDSLQPQKTLIPRIRIHAVKSFVSEDSSDSAPLSIGKLILQQTVERLKKNGHLRDSETLKDKQVKEFIEQSENQEYSENVKSKNQEYSQIASRIPSGSQSTRIGSFDSRRNNVILSNPRRSGQVGIFSAKSQSEGIMTENWKRMFSV